MTWIARVRTEALTLADPVEYTRLTLTENYNTPSTLLIEGTVDDLRPAMVLGWGIVVMDGATQKFSGILANVRRNGDGTAELVYRSDLERLWQRLAWPVPANAWGAQTAAYDVQTANAEARIIGYINRNAGASAWHEVPSGTDPSDSFTVAPFTTLDPTLTYITQACAPDPDTSDLYVTQKLDDDDTYSSPDNLWITRFVAGVQHSQMYLPRGGHGDLFEVRRVKGRVHVVFRYRGLSGVNKNSGTWVSLPWVAGRTWTAKQALVYAIKPLASVKGTGDTQPLYKTGVTTTGIPPRTLPARRSWFQGEARYGNTFYRMYGTAYTSAGSGNPAIPGVIEVIRNNQIVNTIDISNLGRDSGGLPFDNYLEPEGLAIARGATPALLIGVVTGKGAARRHRLYTMPLKFDADDDRLQDRRIKRLRLPTSLGRGAVDKTSARFQNLGQLVAEIAEANELRVDVVQTYTNQTTPWLDVVVSEAPDLSDKVQISGPLDGGDITLGDDWSYSLGLPEVTTALSAAGGEGAARILNASTNADDERTWGSRVESLVDQRDTTDAAEITTGLQTAIDEGGSTTEVSIPLQVNTDELELPLGAKVSALIDGEAVIERIRQVTTEIKNESGNPTVGVTAVLGTPDAGFPDLTAKRLAQAIKRIQRLEAR